jgi:hypothetical protein
MIFLTVIFIVALVLTLFHDAKILWCVLAGTMLIASTAHGQEPPGEDVIVTLKKNQPAPFDGQLFDNPTALRWGIWMQQMQSRHQVELDAKTKHCDTELAFKDIEIQLNAEMSQKVMADLTKRLEKSEQERLQLRYELDHPPWYQSNLFYFAIGAITVGGFTVLAAQTF